MTLFPRKLEEWYKTFTKEERNWLIIALIIALIMSTTTLTWHALDREHQVPVETMEVAPDVFMEKAMRFSMEYAGKVIPEGVDIYLAGVQFRWIPKELKLKKGVTYKIWISSGDVLHGFSLLGYDGTVYNVMVMPGMAYAVNVKFDKTGVYEIRCNEYCGLGHQYMIGKIVVVE